MTFVKSFDEADFFLVKVSGFWFALCRSKDNIGYNLFAKGNSASDVCELLPKSARVLDKMAHECEHEGCSYQTRNRYCNYCR